MIEEAIDYCIGKGIEIVRGPGLDRSSGRIEACGWYGAVLIYNKKIDILFKPGWLKEICEILEKDTYWFWRFGYGFNQGRILEVYTEKLGEKIWHKDKVSEQGMRLGKKYFV